MSNKIFYPSNTEGLDEIAESLLNEETATAGNSAIEDKTDFWRIDNVPYGNRVSSVGLAKTLLDSGNAKTQDEWAEYSRQARQSNGFYVGSFQLYYSLFSQLHSLRENQSMRNIAEEARQFISNKMLKKYLITLTRLQYKASGNDVIIHNYGMPDQSQASGNLTGKDGWITNTDTNAQSMLELLTGESDVAKINEVYKWITGKKSYLWRVNSKQDSERIARFSAVSDGVDLDCYWGSRDSDPAFGVKIL